MLVVFRLFQLSLVRCAVSRLTESEEQSTHIQVFLSVGSLAVGLGVMPTKERVMITSAHPCLAAIKAWTQAGRAPAILALMVAVPIGGDVRAQCVFPPPGLVSCWLGEGNADDAVGGNPGLLSSGVGFVPGVVGQAFSFDGTNGV